MTLLTKTTKGEVFGDAQVHGKAPIRLQEAAGFHTGFSCLQMLQPLRVIVGRLLRHQIV